MRKELLLIVFGIFLISVVSALPSNQLHLNVEVLNSSDDAINGTFNFNFTIYTSSDCSTGSVYSKLFSSITTPKHGKIDFYLTDTSSIDFTEQLYLGYYRDGLLKNCSLMPRAPYANTADILLNSSNQDIGDKNFTTTGSGFFNWIGSLASRVTTLFVGNINATGNIDTSGNVSGSYIKGDGSLLTGISTSGGNPFDQSLNKSDDVLFNSVNISGNINVSNNLFWDAVNKRMSFLDSENIITINGNDYGETLAIHGINDTEIQLGLHRHSNTGAVGAAIDGQRSRGSEGNETAVQDGDDLFNLVALGHDGTDYIISSRIDMEVDGTPGNNDMPGRIVLKTTPDGGVGAIERMRINSDGNINITQNLTLVNIIGSGKYLTDISTYNATYDSKNSSRWNLNETNIYYNSGNIGIGTASPSVKLEVIGASIFGNKKNVDNYIISNGNGSIAGGYADYIGFGNKYGINASGDGSIALGYTLTSDLIASTAGAISLGKQTKATGNGAIAIGEDVIASSTNSFAIGKNFENSITNTIRLGINSAYGLIVNSGGIDVLGNINSTGNLTINGNYISNGTATFSLQDLNTTGGGNPFDQSLNTTDDVTFKNMSADRINEVLYVQAGNGSDIQAKIDMCDLVGICTVKVPKGRYIISPSESINITRGNLNLIGEGAELFRTERHRTIKCDGNINVANVSISGFIFFDNKSATSNNDETIGLDLCNTTDFKVYNNKHYGSTYIGSAAFIGVGDDLRIGTNWKIYNNEVYDVKSAVTYNGNYLQFYDNRFYANNSGTSSESEGIDWNRGNYGNIVNNIFVNFSEEGIDVNGNYITIAVNSITLPALDGVTSVGITSGNNSEDEGKGNTILNNNIIFTGSEATDIGIRIRGNSGNIIGGNSITGNNNGLGLLLKSGNNLIENNQFNNLSLGINSTVSGNNLGINSFESVTTNIYGNFNTELKGKINFGDVSELTIEDGNITITRSYHTIDTEANAGTDNLDCIKGGNDGDVIYFKDESASRDVTFRQTSCSDNDYRIIMKGGADYTITSAADIVHCFYIGAGNGWICNPMRLDSFDSSKDLTLRDKITFALGETIDNLIDGWIRITGSLEVTGDLNVTGNITALQLNNIHFIKNNNYSDMTSEINRRLNNAKDGDTIIFNGIFNTSGKAVPGEWGTIRINKTLKIIATGAIFLNTQAPIDDDEYTVVFDNSQGSSWKGGEFIFSGDSGGGGAFWFNEKTSNTKIENILINGNNSIFGAFGVYQGVQSKVNYLENFRIISMSSAGVIWEGANNSETGGYGFYVDNGIIENTNTGLNVVNKGHRISKNIHISNIDIINSISQGMVIRHTFDSYFSNIEIKNSSSNAIFLGNVSNLHFSDITINGVEKGGNADRGEAIYHAFGFSRDVSYNHININGTKGRVIHLGTSDIQRVQFNNIVATNLNDSVAFFDEFNPSVLMEDIFLNNIIIDNPEPILDNRDYVFYRNIITNQSSREYDGFNISGNSVFNNIVNFNSESIFNGGTTNVAAIKILGISNSSKGSIHIRTDSGQPQYISFTEDAINDKFAIGSDAGDNNIYIRESSAFGEKIITITPTGNLIIGNGTNQVNITMTSPDGTEFSCGVNNSGSFICGN